MGYFTFEHKNIFYTELGTGSPLLLLHGNAASSHMFYEIAQAYAEDYHVILIDFLGHGQSDRLTQFPADLWFYEAEQVIAFLREKQYQNVNMIGSSGGALVAINVALEAPELVHKVIADSFEGEHPLKSFTEHIRDDREESKQDENTRFFYSAMHGADLESVVDHDTDAIIRNDQELGCFLHKEISSLQTDILLTGSKQDEFMCSVEPTYFERVYGNLISKMGHGEIHLFKTGVHPAILSNPTEFHQISKAFFDQSLDE